MQDRYTGDIGDFGKFGLLRALVRENQETVRKLGVIWYLVPDETETTGGNLTAYLDDSAYGALDGDLHMLLRRIVNSGSRSVRLVEENGVLPPDTVFYRDPLDYGGALWASPRHMRFRERWRRQWLAGALRATEACDLVFLDPDNGIASVRVFPHQTKARKYAFLEELRLFVEQGQTVIVIHHPWHVGTVDQQIAHRLRTFQAELSIEKPLCLRLRKGVSRLFFFLPTGKLKTAIAEGAQRFVEGNWGRLFTLSAWDAPVNG